MISNLVKILLLESALHCPGGHSEDLAPPYTLHLSHFEGTPSWMFGSLSELNFRINNTYHISHCSLCVWFCCWCPFGLDDSKVFHSRPTFDLLPTAGLKSHHKWWPISGDLYPVELTRNFWMSQFSLIG